MILEHISRFANSLFKDHEVMALVFDCVVQGNDVLVAGHPHHFDLVFDGKPMLGHLLLVDDLDGHLLECFQVFGEEYT